MNAPGAYDDVNMGGLPKDFYESYVPVEAQKRLIAAFPELRLVYNAKTKVLNIVHRQPGWKESFYGVSGLGALVGWSLIPGEYDLGMGIDQIIGQLRAREYVAVTQCQAEGYKTLAEKVDAIYDEWVAAANAENSDKLDELLGLKKDGSVSPFGIGSGAVISRPYATTFKRYDKPLVRVPQHLLAGVALMPAIPLRQKAGKDK